MGQNKLELILLSKDRMSPAVKNLIKFFQQLRRESNNLDKSLTKLFNKKPNFNFSKQVTADLKKSNQEILKFKKNLESFNKSSGSSYKRNIEKENAEIEKVIGKRNKYLDRLANLNEKVFEPATQIKNVWKEQFDSLKQYTDETKKLYLAQSKFKLINLSPEENKKAFEAVEKSVRDFSNTTRAEGITLLADLHNAFGNLNHALEAFPMASRYKFSMRTLFGDEFSDKQIEGQIQNLYKYLELTGKVTQGREEMERSFNVLTQISSSTSGRVTGADFLAMAKTGGTAAQNLTPEGLRNISAIMQELGGDRTGTSLMSLYQTLVGGVMKQSAAQRFLDFGLLDESKIEFGKAQKIKRILPGANLLGDLAMEDPLKAADRLGQAFREKGIDTNDPKAVNRELALLFGNRNAQRMMSVLMNQRGQILKEADLANNAKNADQMYAGIPDDLKKLDQFENKWKDFKAEIGKPLLEIGSGLAESILPIMKFFADHPEVTKWATAILLAGKGLKAVSETASILSASNFSSFFSKTADSATTASTRVAGFTRNLDTATNKTSALQKLTSNPITIAIATTGAILAIDTIIERLGKVQEMKDKLSEDSKTLGQTYDRLSSFGLLYNNQGNFKDKEGNNQTAEFDNYAKKFVETIKNGRTLELGLDPSRKTWFEWFSDAITPTVEMNPYGRGKVGQFDPQVAANKWKAEGLTKGLADPNVLASVISRIKSDSTFNQNDIKLLLTSLERIVGTEKFNQANDVLQGKVPTPTTQNLPFFPLPEQKNQQQAVTQTTQKFGELKFTVGQLNQPVGGLQQNFADLASKSSPLPQNFSSLSTNSNSATTSVGNLGNAAQGVANRLNVLEIKQPSFSFFPTPTPSFPTIRPFGGGLTGRSKGGSVKKGYVYRINEIGQEFFTPNQSGSVISNDIIRNAQRNSAATSTPNVTLSVTIHVDGTQNPEKVATEIKRELAILVRDLKSELTPRNLARKVAFEAERDNERS